MELQLYLGPKQGASKSLILLGPEGIFMVFDPNPCGLYTRPRKVRNTGSRLGILLVAPRSQGEPEYLTLDLGPSCSP